MKRLLLILLVLALSTAMLIGCGGDDSKGKKGPIKIGLLCPLTGAYASEGQDMKNIVELLAAKVNAKGGLLGRKVEIVLGDDGSNARGASIAAQRLATQGVVAVVGTYGSANTEASQNTFNESKIIQIANGSTSVRLTEKGLKYFLRTCPRDDSQGVAAYKTLSSMGFNKIAILHDNSSYAKGLADETKALLEKNGKKIVFYDALTPKENDYSTILTKIKTTKPDVIFFTGYYNEAGLLLRQSRQMNWNVPFVGGDATNNTDLIKIAGNTAAKGFTCISPPLPQDLLSQDAKDFMAEFKTKFGTTPASIWSILSGDGFQVIANAIATKKSTDPDILVKYLQTEAKGITGLTGKISFNTKGDRIGDVYRKYIVDGSGNFILQP